MIKIQLSEDAVARGMSSRRSAWVVGDLAAHLQAYSDDAWTITHIPTGMQIPRAERHEPYVLDEGQACRIAQALAEFPIWGFDDPKVKPVKGEVYRDLITEAFDRALGFTKAERHTH